MRSALRISVFAGTMSEWTSKNAAFKKNQKGYATTGTCPTVLRVCIADFQVGFAGGTDVAEQCQFWHALRPSASRLCSLTSLSLMRRFVARCERTNQTWKRLVATNMQLSLGASSKYFVHRERMPKPRRGTRSTLSPCSPRRSLSKVKANEDLVSLRTEAMARTFEEGLGRGKRWRCFWRATQSISWVALT